MWIAVLFLSACRNELRLSDNNYKLSGEDYQWSCFYESRDGTLYAGGGETWETAAIAQLTSEGWKIVEESEGSRVLCFGEGDSAIYATGMTGYRHFKQDSIWHTASPVIWDTFIGLFPRENSILAVGGRHDVGTQIFKVKGLGLNEWELISDTLEFFPTSVAITPQSRLIVGGYGKLYVSNKAITAWRDITPGKGIFNAIQVLGNWLYVMNNKGVVYRSKVGDYVWDKIHGRSVNSRFNAMYFFTHDIAYLVGDRGTIKTTLDGGEHWTTYHISEDKVLNDVYRLRDTLYICGNHGLLLQFPAF